MKITNTEVEEKHPEWLMGSNPDAIEDQERRGQMLLIKSTQLPTDIRGDGKQVLERLGIKFSKPDKADPLFCDAQLPKGWEKKSTDHSMWSVLIDGQGNEIASIFYKAAFYDRSAFMLVK